MNERKLGRLSPLVIICFLTCVCWGDETGENPEEVVVIPGREVPGEMAVLSRLVGAWDTYSTNRVSAWNPEEALTSGEAKAKLILGGHFLLCENFDTSPEPYGITIFTYDPSGEEYRAWIFDALGNTVESTGTWDPQAQVLTFVPEQSRSSRFTYGIPDEDTIAYTIVGKDDQGNLLLDVHGKWVRTTDSSAQNNDPVGP